MTAGPEERIAELERDLSEALERQSAAAHVLEVLGSSTFELDPVFETVLQQAVGLCKQSDQRAALGCMVAFGTTDFRDDLPKVTVPALVIHGDSDGIVPFEGSGKRTHDAIDGSELVVIDGGPHGLNVSHAKEFNDALLEFLKK